MRVLRNLAFGCGLSLLLMAQVLAKDTAPANDTTSQSAQNIMPVERPQWDPTQPQLPAIATPKQATQDVLQKTKPLPKLRVSMVKIQSGFAIAMINSQVVQVGDTIEGYLVVAIQPNKVLVSREGQQRPLRLFTTRNARP